MTKVPPATARAQIPVLISRSNEISIRDTTRVLPNTVRAQIPILIRRSVDLSIGSHQAQLELI